ncbi:MAG: hypothetical protein IJG56_01955 [Clostridia bacterium]|nr:hypothetical protein [Clostridia bacterium]
MVKLIVGKKGTGKTKQLVDLVHTALDMSKGNVVCIEKGDSLTYDIKPQVRLVRADEYSIDNYTKMFGFIGGILAGDYDCTDIFIDSITKLCGVDSAAMTAFFISLEELSSSRELTITSTVSADLSEIPEVLHKYVHAQ